MDATGPGQTHQPVHWVLWAMAAAMVGFELVFAAVDAGWLPEALGRWPTYWSLAYFHLHVVEGGFYRLLPVSETAAQYIPVGPAAAWSLVTHAFLHGGWPHLALNGGAFLGLGHRLVRDIGIGRFLAVFVMTAAAGAGCFQMLGPDYLPVVGVSGVLFGMLGMLTAWQERALRQARRSRTVVWQRIGGLVLLNAVLAVWLEGLLAWQAHLGGWVAGWAMAYVYRPRRNEVRLL